MLSNYSYISSLFDNDISQILVSYLSLFIAFTCYVYLAASNHSWLPEIIAFLITNDLVL